MQFEKDMYLKKISYITTPKTGMCMYCANSLIILTLPKSYPYFITVIKHGYRCFIS